MRLNDDQIVDLIGHPEAFVRQAALDYFTQAFLDHPGLFAAVRAAVERYGGDEFIVYWEWFANLKMPEDQIPWLIKQAEAEDSEFADACRYLLFAQDARVLHKHQALWQGNEGLGIGDDTAAWFELRMEMVGTSAADAWAELEGWARERAEIVGEEEVDDSWQADAMAEAAQREDRGELRSRVRELIAEGEQDPAKANYYLMPWAIRLAGAWKLADAAEAIFRYDLETQNDLATNEVGSALAKIGGEAAVQALTGGWQDWGPGQRTLSALYLAYQRGPIAVDTALALAAQCAHDPACRDVLSLLSDCILVHCDQEAGERLIAVLDTDEATTPCAKSLLVWADALGLEDHPGLTRWPELVAQRHAELAAREHQCGPGCGHDHHEHEHDEDCGPDCGHDHGHQHHEHVHGPDCGHEHHEHAIIDAAEDEREVDPDSATVRKGQTRVGRNDPCPCGSGKKYKKCCLLKVASTADFGLDF